MVAELKKKYDALHIEVKASIWFLFCAIIPKGVNIIFTPIITRIMTNEEYGHYSVYNSWSAIISVFVTLNLSYGVFTQTLIKNNDDKRSIITSFQSLTLFLAVIWILIYFAGYSFWNQLLSLETREMTVLLLSIWVTAAYGLWAAKQRVEYKSISLIVTTLLASFFGSAISVAMIVHSNDKVFVKILTTLIINAIVYLPPVISDYLHGSGIKLSYWKYALCFNIPLLPHYLSLIILNNSDRIMIDRLVDTKSAAYYNLAHSIALVSTVLNTGLLQAIHPWLITRIKYKQFHETGAYVYFSISLIVAVNLLLILLAPEAIRLFAPKEYYQSVWIIPPVAMSNVFNFSYGLFADFEFFYNKPHLSSIASIIGAALNIVLNYIFIPIFGYSAAAYTTLFCYILFALFHYIAMFQICNQYLDRARPYNTKIIFSIYMASLLCGFAIMGTYTLSMIRFGIIAACFAAIIIKHHWIEQHLRELFLRKEAKG